LQKMQTETPVTSPRAAQRAMTTGHPEFWEIEALHENPY